MKVKLLLPILALIVFIGCSKDENPTDTGNNNNNNSNNKTLLQHTWKTISARLNSNPDNTLRWAKVQDLTFNSDGTYTVSVGNPVFNEIGTWKLSDDGKKLTRQWTNPSTGVPPQPEDWDITELTETSLKIKLVMNYGGFSMTTYYDFEKVK